MDNDGYRPSNVTLTNERARVLVVDDDAAARLTMTEILADEFRVFTAADAERAFVVLSSERIDLICTDYQMPGQNGLDLLAVATKADPLIAGVLVTGHKEYLARARATDSIDYQVLIKPFDPQQLLTLVRRAINTARLKRTLSGSQRSPNATPRR